MTDTPPPLTTPTTMAANSQKSSGAYDRKLGEHTFVAYKTGIQNTAWICLELDAAIIRTPYTSMLSINVGGHGHKHRFRNFTNAYRAICKKKGIRP